MKFRIIMTLLILGLSTSGFAQELSSLFSQPPKNDELCNNPTIRTKCCKPRTSGNHVYYQWNSTDPSTDKDNAISDENKLFCERAANKELIKSCEEAYEKFQKKYTEHKTACQHSKIIENTSADKCSQQISECVAASKQRIKKGEGVTIQSRKNKKCEAIGIGTYDQVKREFEDAQDHLDDITENLNQLQKALVDSSQDLENQKQQLDLEIQKQQAELEQLPLKLSSEQVKLDQQTRVEYDKYVDEIESLTEAMRNLETSEKRKAYDTYKRELRAIKINCEEKAKQQQQKVIDYERAQKAAGKYKVRGLSELYATRNFMYGKNKSNLCKNASLSKKCSRHLFTIEKRYKLCQEERATLNARTSAEERYAAALEAIANQKIQLQKRMQSLDRRYANFVKSQDQNYKEITKSLHYAEYSIKRNINTLTQQKTLLERQAFQQQQQIQQKISQEQQRQHQARATFGNTLTALQKHENFGRIEEKDFEKFVEATQAYGELEYLYEAAQKSCCEGESKIPGVKVKITCGKNIYSSGSGDGSN